MDITPLITKESKIINSYGANEFHISGEVYRENIMIFPDKVMAWHVNKFEDINISNLLAFQDQLELLDILLIGCGESHKIMSSSLKNDIKKLCSGRNHGGYTLYNSIEYPKTVSIEVMTTSAACRTYNILLTEGRKVGAALIKV